MELPQEPVVPISVGIPACHRVQKLRTTLRRVLNCNPLPSEIIVHLDGNNAEILQLLESEFPQVLLLHSSEGGQGPGGARNRLAEAASFDWLANFDDDSFPCEPTFFEKAWMLIQAHPDVAVISGSTEEENLEPGSLWLQAVYPGNCHLLNREWFFRTAGYTPLPVAYNMEEVDVSLQLHQLGGLCIQAADLRVIHDHPPPQREAPHIQVGMLLNTTLFPILRYPVAGFPHAFGSVVRRFCRTIANRDFGVLTQFLIQVPSFIGKHMHRRCPVSPETLVSWLHLRRCPVKVR